MPRKYALDCEMVESFGKSMLARVSIVDENERVVLDTYVMPTAEVTDFREFWSGVTEEHLINGEDIRVVRHQVRCILNGCILIGHSLHFDLAVLDLQHPESDRRDLATYEPFTRKPSGQPMSLRKLAEEYLGRNIQMGLHCSVEDAKASMAIYKVVEHEWERREQRKVFEHEWERREQRPIQVQQWIHRERRPIRFEYEVQGETKSWPKIIALIALVIAFLLYQSSKELK